MRHCSSCVDIATTIYITQDKYSLFQPFTLYTLYSPYYESGTMVRPSNAMVNKRKGPCIHQIKKQTKNPCDIYLTNKYVMEERPFYLQEEKTTVVL